MKDKDLVILSHLRRNSREVLTRISRKSGIPISTLHDRIKAGVGGYINKYTVLLDFGKMGFNTRAKVTLKVAKDDKQKLLERLEKIPNVNSIYRINNGYDFMLDCIFRNMVELENFLEDIEARFEIQKRDIYYIISSIKQEEFAAQPSVVGLVAN